MAWSLNMVQIVGNLGQDPEAFGQDFAGCRLSVATHEAWTDKQGRRQERTEWHRVTVFGKRGRACFDHLRKGAQVYVRGRLETRKWQTESGETRWSTEIAAIEVGFLGRPRTGAQPAGPGIPDYAPIGDDDVPF